VVVVPYLLAIVLLAAMAGLAIYRARHPPTNEPPARAPRPVPWQETGLAKPFAWSAAGWRFVTWGACISFSLVGAVMLGVQEERSIVRFVIGIAIVSGVLAGIAEAYFWLLKSAAVGRSRALLAALACAWFLMPPLVLTAAYFALRSDAPAPQSPVAAPEYHVTVVTTTGPFTETDEYDTGGNRGQAFFPTMILAYAAILSGAWIGLGGVPLIYAAGRR
jgi:hypothetical protein